MRRRTHASVSGSVVACLLMVAAAAAQPAPSASPSWALAAPLEALQSAQELKDRTDQLRRGIWTLYAQDVTTAADIRGRTQKQDVNGWLLPPATAARLEALQAKANAQESAHQQPALRKTLDEATALLQQQAYHGDLINNYWYWQTRLIEHQKLLDGLRARLPEPTRPGPPVVITTGLTQASEQLAAALAAENPSVADQRAAADKLGATLGNLIAAYDAQRAGLGRAVGESERARGVAPLSLTRTDPCPPAPVAAAPAPPATASPDAPAAGTALRIPRFAPGNTASEVYYPPEFRRLEVQGFTVVSATISATGCPLKAEVYTPSGAAAFDESALKWALSASYLPAERDHQAVEAPMKMGVRFKLRD